MGVVAEDGKFVGQTLTTSEALKAFFDLQLPDKNHWRDRLWERVDAGELSEDEGLDLIIKGTNDNLVTAGEEVAGVVRWPVLRIIDGELVSAEFGPLSVYTDLSKPDGQLASKQARAIVRYFEQRNTPSQIFYAFSDQACGCFGVMMNYKPDTGEIMAVSKYYPMGVEELGRVFDRLNGEGREMIVIDGEVIDNPLGWQIRVDQEKDFICLDEQEQVIGMVMGDGVTETVVPEFKNQSVWLGWGAGIGMGDVHLGSGHGEVSVTEVPVYASLPVVADVQPHPRDGVETVVQDWVELVKPQERKSVKGVKVGDTEVIMENLPVGGQAEILVPPHPRGGVEIEVLGVSELRATIQVEEHQERKSIKAEKVMVPVMTRVIPVNDILVPVVTEKVLVVSERDWVDLVSLPEPISAVQEPHPRGGVEVVAEEVVAPTVTRMIPVDEVVVDQATSDISMPSVIEEVSGVDNTERIEEVITESTEVIKKAQKVVVFSAFSDRVSVVSVIKEMFNEQIIEHKRYQSVKAKVIGLQRQIANVVADQLIGRVSDTDLGWLVHGWAMMQFDGIEEKQKMRRFRLSPVRLWADRVTRVVRRVKDKFVRTGFGVYKYLFAAI